MILDTSGLLAALDTSEVMHVATRQAIEDDEGPLVLSPFILAELDYMLGVRSTDAEIALLRDVGAGAYRLEPMGTDDVLAAARIVERYRDIEVGLADASIVVIADRLHTRRVLTLDARHFRALRPLSGGTFSILPSDPR